MRGTSHLSDLSEGPKADSPEGQILPNTSLHTAQGDEGPSQASPSPPVKGKDTTSSHPTPPSLMPLSLKPWASGRCPGLCSAADRVVSFGAEDIQGGGLLHPQFVSRCIMTFLCDLGGCSPSLGAPDNEIPC